MEKIQQYIPLIQEQTMFYGIAIIKALAIFMVGKWLAKILSKIIGKASSRTFKDPILEKFAVNFSFVLMMTFVVIASISQLGVQRL